MLDPEYEQDDRDATYLAEARLLGASDGDAAAAWTYDGNTPQGWYARVLATPKSWTACPRRTLAGNGQTDVRRAALPLTSSATRTRTACVSGPHGLTIEVYDYRGRNVLAEDAIAPFDADGNLQPLRLSILHHPTTAYYPENDR